MVLRLGDTRTLKRTKGLLDDLENLLVIKLGRDTLHGGQGLASIALCNIPSALNISRTKVAAARPKGHATVGRVTAGHRGKHTLNANMDILLGLSSLSRVLVGFGEGV